MAEAMQGWLGELQANVANGDLDTWTDFDFNTVAKDAEGFGLFEAPRGALGHWVRIKDGRKINKIELNQKIQSLHNLYQPLDEKIKRLNEEIKLYKNIILRGICYEITRVVWVEE